MFIEYINKAIEIINVYASIYLIPLMLVVFLGALVVRIIVYITIKSENAFISEFEKRVHKYLGDPNYEKRFDNFHELVKTLLNRTFEEHYNIKRKFRRRRFDQITCLSERIFLIPEGANKIISDTLSQTIYLRKEGRQPNFLEISKWVFESNPVFNRVIGVFPLGMSNDVLNILPGIFVIGGIFGTFVGVTQALPMLSEIDITKIDATKAIMDAFLLKMAFSMGTSIVGIIFSVAMTIANAIMNPDSIYYSIVTKFTSSLEFLWNDTTINYMSEKTENQDRRGIVFSNIAQKSDSDVEEKVCVSNSKNVSTNIEGTLDSEKIVDKEKLLEVFKDTFEELEKKEVTNDANTELYVGEIQSLGIDSEELSKVANELEDSEEVGSSDMGIDDTRLSVLKHRLKVLDSYLNEFDTKLKSGEMNEEMWKDERNKVLSEKETLENEVLKLETKKVA